MRKRKAKPKTQAQIDHAAEQHRQKRYGVGLDYYVSQLEKQDGGCGICGAPPGKRRLHIDHDHSWTKVKVIANKNNQFTGDRLWTSYAEYLGNAYYGNGRTKSVAIRLVKAMLKKASVRGLLSYSCNVGLQKFNDSPVLLRAAAAYLENHQGNNDPRGRSKDL